jgi:hypothetical protein
MVRAYFEPRLQDQGFNSNQIGMMISDACYYLMSFQEQGQEAIRYPYSFASSQFKEILLEEGFGDAELFLTEWNVAGLFDQRHDTHYGASFITRGLIDLTDSFTVAQAFYALSSQNHGRGFEEYRGDFSLFVGGIPKASFNAFRSFAMLGYDSERISVVSSDNDIYSIATKDQSSVSLLATYYVGGEVAGFGSLPSVKKVTVEIGNIPFDQYDYEIYLIDRNHSNDFFGSGPELELIGQGTVSYENSGDFEISGYLGIYGVVLIKISKIQS